MGWQRFEAEIDSCDLDYTQSLLGLSGAEAVALADADRAALYEPEPGKTPIWPKVRIHALFDDGIDLERLGRLIRTCVPTARAIVVRAVRREDWERAATEAVAPMRFGTRLRILPAMDSGAENDGSAVDTLDIRLRMGLAFGTGRHPTTALCLRWLDAHPGLAATVLDYGCGSGVLAIAALALGAERAYAVDTDPQALTAARDNARLNGVDDRLWTGTARALPDFEADLALANILAPTLESLAERLAERVTTGGRIVLSGLLVEETERVQQAYAAHFEDFATATLEGWALIAAMRSPR